MSELIITITCGDERSINLNITQKLKRNVGDLIHLISATFDVNVEYVQIVRDNKIFDIDLEKIYLLYDFRFKNGDTLLANNPHAKATKKDMVGDIPLNFEFQGMSVNIWTKKENRISELYDLVRNENAFNDNFCLKYNGEVLSHFSRFTVFERGIKKNDIIEIYGELNFN